MNNVFSQALEKIVSALKAENIDYMIVGGFAVSYHNRTRTTNDIDLILQIKPDQVSKILKYFPLWQGFEEAFKDDIKRGIIFNITDYETGIRYDFMAYKGHEYGKTAFERREKVEFFEVKCYMSTKEDLIISKFRWHNISPSKKQMEDIRFLILDESLDFEYIQFWTNNLNLETYGLLG